MALQGWAQPSSEPPEWAVEAGARTHSSPSAESSNTPIEGALSQIEQVLDGVSTGGWRSVPEGHVRDLTVRLARLSARLCAHHMAAARVMEEAGIAHRAGAASTGQLMAKDFGGDRRATDDLVRTARVLEESGASATEGALAAGRISQSQAKVIGRTVAALPKHLTEQEREEVERHLLVEAQRLSLADLRRRSKRALQDVRPNPEADEDEDKATARQERTAWEKACFSMWDRQDGTHGFNGILPDLQAHQLRALLDAVVSPRRRHVVDDPDHAATGTGSSEGARSPSQGTGSSEGTSSPSEGTSSPSGAPGAATTGAGTDTSPDAPPPTEPEDMTPYPNQLGRALCGIIEHFPTDGFVQTGGSPVSLAITFAYQHLADATTAVAGTLTDGLRVSAGQVRRLACTQQLIPQVFNGRSVPLDQGTAKRLFTKEQRRILAQRDLGCAFPGCDRPPQWCDAHHLRSWSKGGTTNLGNGVLLCFFHHHAVHDQGWAVRLHPREGTAEFAHPEHTGGQWHRNHRFRASTDLVPRLGAVP